MTDKSVSRRKLLAAAGAILFAGCGSDGSEQGSFGTRFAEETDTATATATRTATTAQAADINIETRTETERRAQETTRRTETATETETETPTPSPEEPMEAARTGIRGALSEFWRYGTSAETLVSVTAASIDFDTQAVLDEIATARNHLDDAESFGVVDQERIENHRTFATLVERLANTQTAVIDCYRTLQDVLENLYAENLNEAGGARARFASAVEDARSRLDRFQLRTRDGNTTAIDIVSRDDYGEKVDQWEREISGFEELPDPLEKTRSGIQSFAAGVDSYTTTDYRSAESEFFAANNESQLADSTLRSYDAPDAISGTVGTFRDAVSQLDTGTGSLTDSAAAGREGDGGERREALGDGLEALRQSEEVRNLPSYEQLANETES